VNEEVIEILEHLLDGRALLHHAPHHALKERGDEPGLEVVPRDVGDDHEHALGVQLEDVHQVTSYPFFVK
jgi:hypothetical protein